MKLRSLLVIASSILTASILYASDDEMDLFQGPQPKKFQFDSNNNNNQINPHIKARDILDQKLLGEIDWKELVKQLLKLDLQYGEKQLFLATASTENEEWSAFLTDDLNEEDKKLYMRSVLAGVEFKDQQNDFIATSGRTFKFLQVSIPYVSTQNIDTFKNKLLGLKTSYLTHIALYVCANQCDNFWDKFLPFLKNNQELKRLTVYDNPKNQGFMKTIDVINSTQISALSLIRVKLNDDSVIKISTTLKNNQNIKVLDLSDNKITDRGGYAIFNLLNVNTGIRAVNLSRNKLTEQFKEWFKIYGKGRVKITL